MNGSKQFKHVTHVIFDLDGVILDTERLYTVATQKIVSKYGKTFNWCTKSQIMGLTGLEASQRIVQLLDLPITADEYYQLARTEYAIVMKDADIMPDTELVYKNVIANIAKRFGKKYSPEIQSKVIGRTERESSRVAVTEMKLPISVDLFQREFRQASHQRFNSVPLIPGAAKLVKHLKSHKIPIAVATSSSQDSFDLKTEKHKELFSLFNHIVCGGSDPDVKEGKPKPDIFLVCASRFPGRPEPEKCLVFEDAPNGLTAAISAGMQTVMIPDENVPAELQKGANVVINSLEEVPLQLFGLPPLK